MKRYPYRWLTKVRVKRIVIIEFLYRQPYAFSKTKWHFLLRGRGNFMAKKDMDVLVAHAKSSGFVYQGSEIYDGLANTWDYGPLGVQMKNNIKQAWWKKFIQESPYNVGIDAAILMNPRVWEATGHIGGFSDPLMDCKECHTRHRADKLI